MLWLVNFMVSLNIMEINYVTARTTIRLWHNLYSHMSDEVQYSNLFVPRKNFMYIAVVNADDIKVIAACERDTTATMSFTMLASAPNNDEICNILIREMIKNKIKPNYKLLVRQPRWYIASKFYE